MTLNSRRWCHADRRSPARRGFFQALIAGNLDIGRPANVEVIFNRHLRRDSPGVFRTGTTSGASRAT